MFTKDIKFQCFKVFWAILGLLLPRIPKDFLQTCMLVDLTIQWPNGVPIYEQIFFRGRSSTDQE